MPNPITLPWIEVALGEIGQREIVGKRHNPRILEYQECCRGSYSGDETPWCSAFLNWVMDECNITGTYRRNARSWLDWSTELSIPVFGCVVVYWRGTKAGPYGHVGFWIAERDGQIWTLGGNQGNAVSIRPYPASRVLGYRYP